MRLKLNWDALGITTSILCAIHCAILPLLVASFPVFGVNIVDNTFFEYGMIGLAFAIGSWALWHGFSRHHRRLTPWLLFTGGILLLLAKQFWHQYQFRLLPFAVILIVIAHIINYRLTPRSYTRNLPPLHRSGTRLPKGGVPPSPLKGE